MRWRQFVKTINLDCILNYSLKIVQSIIEVWAIFRITIILLLVLYTIVINVHTSFDERCEDETLDAINNTLCGYHDSWGINP